jgi:hypothetical protein
VQPGENTPIAATGDAPAWSLLVAGFLFAAATIDAFEVREARALDPRRLFLATPREGVDRARPAVDDLDRWSPRELRRLPGIGQARALAIARARFDEGLRGGVDMLERVPGIGPETTRRIRAWLAERSERP